MPDLKHDEIYGYVTTEDTKTVTTEIYKQTVDDLDLTSVVSVVNGVAAKPYPTER